MVVFIWNLLALQAVAKSFVEESIQLSHKRAVLVMDVTINSSAPLSAVEAACGVNYQGTIKSIAKGKFSQNEINFGFMQGLNVGEAYTVFLFPSDDAALLMGILRSKTDSISDARDFLSNCLSLFPNYYFFRVEKRQSEPAVIKK
jgi:hypothetical protein